MPSTTFNPGTVIPSAWLNEINAGVFTTLPTASALASAAMPSATLAASGGSNLVGFLQGGTGAVPQTVQTVARNVVSPDNYGAIGDGTTDDSAAFTKAITYIASRGGGQLTLTPGKTYLLNAQVNVCDNLTVWAYGATIKAGYGFAGINRPLFKNFSGTDFSAPGTRVASKNVRFYGGKWEGQDTGTAGALIPNANMHCSFICMGGWTANSGVDTFVVRDCDMSQLAGSGVMAWKSSNVDISGNTFLNFFGNVGLSVGSPIDLHEVDRYTIIGNKMNHTAAGYSWHGMVILDWDAGSSNGVAAYNIITNMNQGDGISCEGNSLNNLTNGVFVGNVVKNCVGDGIGVDRCVRVTVTGNIIESVTGMGVLFTETEYAEISGNTITTAGLGGIVCRAGVVRGAIVGNTITGVTYQDSNYRGHGIEVSDTGLADGGQLEVSGNIIRDVDGCGIYGSVVNGTITGNNIYNAGRSASNPVTLRAGVFAIAPMYVEGNTIVSSGNTQYAVSSGANDMPSMSGNRLRGTFGTAYYYIGYRGTGINHAMSVNIEDATYDSRTNIFTGRFNGTPAGYWYKGDTMYATQPAAGGFIGSVVVTTGTTWKTFGAITP